MSNFEDAASRVLSSIDMYKKTHSVRSGEFMDLLNDSLLAINRMHVDNSKLTNDMKIIKEGIVLNEKMHEEEIRAWKEHAEKFNDVTPTPTIRGEGFLEYKEQDLVIDREPYSCDIRIVEHVDEYGILLVNGVQDAYYENYEDFKQRYRLLVKVENAIWEDENE